MGYDVHITRAESWLDAAAQPITLDEWLAFANSDPEMRVDGRAEAEITERELVALVSPGVAVWCAYSKDGLDGNHAWFDLQRGCVVVKNPDVEILRKMSHIARHFGAKVQGDDGEDYDSQGRPVVSDARPAWWRRLFRR